MFHTPPPPARTPSLPQMGFLVRLSQGGLPGPGLSGASPTLALTPQCGLDVATVPYKPQCAAGAGAGLGWVERKTAQDSAMKTPTKSEKMESVKGKHGPKKGWKKTGNLQ